MITCQRCNTENIEGSQYCDECGALLGGAPARAKRPDTKPTDEGGGAFGSGGIIAAPGANGGEPSKVMEASLSTHSEVSAASARTSGTGFVPSSEGRAPVASGNRAGDFNESDARPEDSAASSGAAGGPHARLVIHRGRSVGKEFPLSDDESQIGRWDADGGIFPDVDLDADDPEAKVSRRHARITRRGEQYYIEDLGSTNGTFINRGRRLLPGDRQLLRDGDEVIVGKTFLRFHVLK
ncbi:MAG TPA: FHA domain-containing protein [Pyrinomonadaceae bacterium]|jgi:hypothetical protein|nr:FHA domain-containing protein [Pyrinomonadaceae bacterium]